MDKAYLKQKLTILVSALLVALLIVYLLFHATSGLARGVETHLVTATVADRTLALDGYIFRDESPLFSSYTGSSAYAVGNGAKVGRNDALVTVYAQSSNDTLIHELDVLSERLALLETAQAASATDAQKIDRRISELLVTMKRHLLDGDYAFALSGEGELLLSLSEKQLARDEDASFTETIHALASSIASLRTRLSGPSVTLTSDEPGYFYYDCDGCESLFTADALENITASSFETLAEAARAATVPVGAVGKLVRSHEWHIVSRVRATDAQAFRVGSAYPLIFPQNADARLPSVLERVVPDAETGDAILVFTLSYLPDGFDYSRAQNVRVVTGSVSGYAVPASAMHFEDGRPCVYVLRGGMLYRRSVDILDRFDGYYYVSAESESVLDTEGTVLYRALGDSEYVVTYGRGLAHRKVIS